MRKIPSPFSRVLPLALFLALAVPSPAHADLSIGGLLSGISGLFSSLGNLITGGLMGVTAGTTQGLNVLFEGNKRLGEYAALQNHKTQKAAVIAAASENYKPVSNYACAVATDNRSEPGRVVAETIAAESVENLMVQLFKGGNAGNIIDQQKLDKIFCSLGVTGNRQGKNCTVAADPRVEGADISFMKAIGNKFCIPYDEQEVFNSLQQLAQNPDYKPPANSLLAIAAILSIRQSLGTHCPWPKDEQMKTTTSVSGTNRMRNVLSSRFAKSQAMMEALKYHLCFSQTMLPNCISNDHGLLHYLKESYSSQRFEVPPNNFCISRWQADMARNIRDGWAQGQEYSSGQDIQRDQFYLTIDLVRNRRNEAHASVVQQASEAYASANTDESCAETNRPMGNSELEKMGETLRNLTRALEKINRQLPRALEVKAHEGTVRPGNNAAALPPIRQEFETVQ